MRTLMIILAVALTACGKAGEKETPVCKETAIADYVVYPDGVGRKSRQVSCTYKSGAVCVYTTSTANPNTAFVACE